MNDTLFAILAELAKSKDLPPDTLARALNSPKVKSAKPKTEAQQLPDGGGLLLFISPSGAKSWRYRYRLAEKGQTLTIGNYPEISLADARTAHRAARWLVERGIHPKAHIDAEIERREAERRAAELSTFRALWKEFDETTAPNLRPRTLGRRTSELNTHILPTLGDKHVAAITRKEILSLLTAIDRKSPSTASQCLGFIKQVLEMAVDRELIPGNPTPKASMLIGHRLHKTTPRRALPVASLGRFLVALSEDERTDNTTRSAMRLLLLTWGRTAEIVGAEWAEFDLDAATWRIHGERMKGEELHTVYLSRQAVALLRDLKLISHGRFLFPNRQRPGDACMDRGTFLKMRQRLGFPDIDIHGFRAVASTWANESGKYRPDVIEVALAHKEADRIRAAYNRAKFADELRLLWQEWADFLDEREAIERGGNVVLIGDHKAA